MTKPLADKIALVTGASRGLGRAIAQALAEDGALVAVHYGASRAGAEDAVAAIKTAGGDAFAVGADLRAPDAAQTLFAALDAELARRFGAPHLDILVNNAGVAGFGALGELDAAGLDQMVDVNIKALYRVSEEAAKRLRPGGRIINLSTAVTRVGLPQAIFYAASKGFVDSFTRSLAAALGEREITVNAIAPGAIPTDMGAGMFATEESTQWVLSTQALKRKARPEDVAGVARWLAGPHSGWTTGQVIDASGGTRIGF